MSHLDTGDARRRWLGLVFQIMGLGDVALGAAIAVMPPPMLWSTNAKDQHFCA